MEIKVDTDRIMGYLQSHLKVISPFAMWFLSYEIVKHINCDSIGLTIFFGAMGIFTFILSVVLTLSLLGTIFDWNF